MVEIVLAAADSGGDGGGINLSGLRALRLLRAFKLARSFKGLRDMIRTMTASLAQTRDLAALLLLLMVALRLELKTAPAYCCPLVALRLELKTAPSHCR